MRYRLARRAECTSLYVAYLTTKMAMWFKRLGNLPDARLIEVLRVLQAIFAM